MKRSIPPRFVLIPFLEDLLLTLALAPKARIGSPGEPGEPLRITGSVFDHAGRPAPGIVVYAYQTNAEGHYPPDVARRGQPSARHGRLRVWAKSDADGAYAFDTIRLQRNGASRFFLAAFL